MKKPPFLLLGLLTLALGSARLSAQNLGVTVKIGVNVGWSQLWSFSIGGACLPSNDHPNGTYQLGSFGTTSGGTAQSYATIQVQPDAINTVSFILGNNTNDIPPGVSGSLTIAAPPGYQVLMAGSTAGGPGTGEYTYAFSNEGTSATPLSIAFVILPPNEWRGPAGAPSSITSGQVHWSVALGSLLNGNSAGAISLADPGTESSFASLCTPQALQYFTTSSDVQLIGNQFGIYPMSGGTGAYSTMAGSGATHWQIIVPQAWVDIYTPASTSDCEIDFYTPVSTTGYGGTLSDGTYNFGAVTTKFVSYLIQPLSGASLQITRTVYQGNGQPGQQPSIAYTSVTSLSCNTSNNSWTLNDWWDGTGPQQRTETRAWSTDSNGNPIQTISEYNASDAVDFVAINAFQTFNWGQEAIYTQLGSSGAIPAPTTQPVTSFAYVTNASSPSYGLPQATTSPTGTELQYDYYSVDNFGNNDPAWYCVQNDLYQPFGPSGTQQTTTYIYSDDYFNLPTRPAGSTTQVGATTVASSITKYADPSPTGNPYLGYGSLDIVQAKRIDSTGSGTTLTTLTNYYREDTSWGFFNGLTTSVVQPDGSQVSYAYQLDNFTPGSSTSPASITSGIIDDNAIASAMGVVTGSSTSAGGGTQVNSFSLSNATFQVDSIYLISGKSTLHLTLRDAFADVRCVEDYVWTGSSWQLLSWTNYTYDGDGNLVGTVSSSGATTSATYDGDRKMSETDAAGVTTNYTYDSAGRVLTVTKGNGPTTTYAYNTLGKVLGQTVSDGGTDTPLVSVTAYDQAGRLQSQTPAGLGTTSYAYAYGSSAGGIANATYAVTATDPDGGIRTDAYEVDGRILSTQGSAVVEQDYAYSVLDGTTNSGYLNTAVTAGGSGSSRTTTTVTDWLGRAVSISHPGPPGQPTYVESHYYDAASDGQSLPAPGHLVEVDRPDYAPFQYAYDAMGNPILSGFDLGGGLNPASNDRLTGTVSYVESYTPPNGSGGYWLHQETDAYPTAGSGTPFATSIVRTRLTGFGSGQIAETLSADSYGNLTDQVTSVNPGTATETITTTVPGTSSPAVETLVNGVETQAQGADGLVTAFGYDGLRRPSTTTDSRGNTTTTTYVAGSALVYQVTDASQAVLATYGYDGLGRKTSVMDADGNISRFDYDPAGRLIHQYGPGAYPVLYAYDSYGERTSMTTFANPTPFTGTSWPSTSNLPPVQNATAWNYDGPSGVLTSKTDAATNSVNYTYTAAGQLYQRAWARRLIPNDSNSPLVTKTCGYDTTGAILSLTYNDGTPPVSYSYYRDGQVKAVTDATGQRTFAYGTGPSGNPLELDTISLPSFYDSAVASGGTPRVLTRLYNSSFSGDLSLPGRPSGFELGSVANTSADLEQSYGFNAQGYFSDLATSSSSVPSVAYHYAYESNSALVQAVGVPVAGGGYQYQASYGYDPQRNLVTSLTTTWGGGSALTAFNYTYSPARQRLTAQQSGSAYADYWNGASDYSSVYNAYAYDTYGQLQSALMAKGPASYPPASANELPGRSFQYRYDGLGNRTSSGETGVSDQNGGSDDSYGTNSVNQYTAKTNDTIRVLGDTLDGATVTISGVGTVGQLESDFGADYLPGQGGAAACGTLTVSAQMPQSSGPGTASVAWFIPPQPQSPTYDPDGNLTYDGVWSYNYDGENRVIGMSSITLAGWAESNISITFTYDYLGRRVEKQVLSNGQTTWNRCYLYDGSNLVAEIDPNTGNLLRSYTWGLDLTGDLSATEGVGALLQITNYVYSGGGLTGFGLYNPAYDGNGNVAALVNENSGALAAVYEYGPFGEPLRNEVIDANIGDNAFRFSTKYEDLETHLVNYGARLYSPAWGRFLSRDPIEEAGGVNLYGFCGNDGIDGVDVGGRQEATYNSATGSYYYNVGPTAAQITAFLQAITNGQSNNGDIDGDLFNWTGYPGAGFWLDGIEDGSTDYNPANVVFAGVYGTYGPPGTEPPSQANLQQAVQKLNQAGYWVQTGSSGGAVKAFSVQNAEGNYLINLVLDEESGEWISLDQNGDPIDPNSAGVQNALGPGDTFTSVGGGVPLSERIEQFGWGAASLVGGVVGAVLTVAGTPSTVTGIGLVPVVLSATASAGAISYGASNMVDAFSSDRDDSDTVLNAPNSVPTLLARAIGGQTAQDITGWVETTVGLGSGLLEEPTVPNGLSGLRQVNNTVNTAQEIQALYGLSQSSG